MSRNRFVTTATARLDLSDGDWVEIKRELSVGERKKLEASPMNSVRPGEHVKTDPNDVEMGLDWGRYYLVKLQVYIVAWSFEDASGKSVRVTADAINNLDSDTAEEIMEAINQHEEKVADAKKVRNISSLPGAISS
jgi:hypothetical protein